ncbi:MAG: hypothetical protein IPP73_18685 [Chitinophagaceae bacterium]|nr:hypothetical protein [Chitinophagaceae bacterium]
MLAQNIDGVINVKEENVLKEYWQRMICTAENVYPDIEKAADFIAGEFKTIGLQTWHNSGSFRQEFTLSSTELNKYGIRSMPESQYAPQCCSSLTEKQARGICDLFRTL